MGYSVVTPDKLEWVTRPPEPGAAERLQGADLAAPTEAVPASPARPDAAAGVTDRAGLQHTRANLWRYEPGARGRRHKDMAQEETFVVVHGTLTMYLGDPPERHQVGRGGLVHVEAGTPLQVVNESDEDLLLFIYGAPPERGHAEFLDSAV